MGWDREASHGSGCLKPQRTENCRNFGGNRWIIINASMKLKLAMRQAEVTAAGPLLMLESKLLLSASTARVVTTPH